jgi:hypothetical protein
MIIYSALHSAWGIRWRLMPRPPESHTLADTQRDVLLQDMQEEVDMLRAVGWAGEDALPPARAPTVMGGVASSSTASSSTHREGYWAEHSGVPPSSAGAAPARSPVHPLDRDGPYRQS